jgi:hypothetical protein
MRLFGKPRVERVWVKNRYGEVMRGFMQVTVSSTRLVAPIATSGSWYEANKKGEIKNDYYVSWFR